MHSNHFVTMQAPAPDGESPRRVPESPRARGMSAEQAEECHHGQVGAEAGRVRRLGRKTTVAADRW